MFIGVSLLLIASLLSGHVAADGPRDQCVAVWNVRQAVQTCQTVSSGVGVPVDWLLAHNPDLVCDGKELPIGTRICTRTYFPTCYQWEIATQTQCERDPMLTQWKLSRDKFVDLNDNVDPNTCALIVGNEYCVTDDLCTVRPDQCARK
ncbi:hypothetical protein EXIGLDRAFT_830173 [Exidia glandulosa HHB12029]|uniref:LysM domain-containing protein n=1 Tax=Exidia glandulosa HHB12029 TaxID=1314781 RepID=A0A165NTR3_EXIGL|nr:hypothetical protein EXIGLDRAFT_830173 [Exidia glandulosa HHB12029]